VLLEVLAAVELRDAFPQKRRWRFVAFTHGSGVSISSLHDVKGRGSMDVVDSGWRPAAGDRTGRIAPYCLSYTAMLVSVLPAASVTFVVSVRVL
jgi:hypothetical protein